MRENLPIVGYGLAVMAVLLVGAWVAERRAARRDYREAEALQRARRVTTPKGH